jgi:hypothetical protein
LEHALDPRVRDEECDAATATPSVESKHEAGSYGRSAITLRVNAECPMIPAQLRRRLAQILETRVPHQRAVTEHP